MAFGAYSFPSKPKSIASCWITLENNWLFISKSPEPPCLFASPIDFDIVTSAEELTESQNSILLVSTSDIGQISVIICMPSRYETLALISRLVSLTKQYKIEIKKPLQYSEMSIETISTSWMKSNKQRLLFNKNGFAISRDREIAKVINMSKIQTVSLTPDGTYLLIRTNIDSEDTKVGPFQLQQVKDIITLFLNLRRSSPSS